MFRDDYLIRLIKQLAAFVARIAGKREAGEYQAALAEAGKAWEELIGQPPRELVELVDTHTLAGLLKEPAKMRVAAQLLIEEGRAYAGKGDPAHATVCYRRAFELYLEARVLEPSDDDTAVIGELARLVPANLLDARYREGS
jgi:tetratricopeptide (TPR) repeat protein